MEGGGSQHSDTLASQQHNMEAVTVEEEEVTGKEEMLTEDEEIVTEEVVEEVEYKSSKHCLAGTARGGWCGQHSRCLPPRPPARVAARRPTYPTPAAGPRPEPPPRGSRVSDNRL